jgi:hypothetical protein
MHYATLCDDNMPKIDTQPSQTEDIMTNDTTTYTVLDYNGTVIDRGLSLTGAADVLLYHDGNNYEIRPDHLGDHGWRLWITRYGHASTLGNLPMVSTCFYSPEDDEAAAIADIYRQVITCNDHRSNCSVMTDADYDEMIGSVED